MADVVADKRPRVRFKAADQSKGVVEALFSHVNDMKDIKKGEKITVRGECEGWQKNIVEIALSKVVSVETATQ